MNALRRALLRGSAGLALLPLLYPLRLLAAEWKQPAFTARNIGDALKAYGASSAVDTRDIVIQAPEVAENGAKVDVEITCNLPNVRTLAIFAERNPTPLCAEIEFLGGSLPYAKLQLKLAESAKLRAVVRTGEGKTWVASREIKVTLGGCGN